MILKLTHKLKERGYKHNQITRHINSVKFNQREETLTKSKHKNNNQQKLVFTTQFNDDANRLKQIIKKHWKLIHRNKTLKAVFPNAPIIAFRGNPSLRNELIRAKLKPIEDTQPLTLTQCDLNEPPKIPQDYPHNIFSESSQNFRNPIKKCCKGCIICSRMLTTCFVQSTSLGHRYPITPPNPKQSFNCKTKNVVYLITCTTHRCRSQYIGYTTREFMFRAAEHISDEKSPITKHCKENKHDHTIPNLRQSTRQRTPQREMAETKRIPMDMQTWHANQTKQEGPKQTNI